MKILLELSMECESLARAEALSVAHSLSGDPKVLHEEPGVVVVETGAEPTDLVARLGLCHYVSEWLGSCDRGQVERFSRRIDVPGPIRVRSTKVGEMSVDLAATTRKVGAIVGKDLGVDLRHPSSELRVVFSNNVNFGRVLGAIDRSSFEKRKNRYLPFIYPASLHPKFARALVNLTQVKKDGKLLDPFCGTGAMIAEASMVGLNAIGTDLSEKMIDGARRNLSHLKLDATLRRCDVGDIVREIGDVDGIATDPPYGRSTSTEGERIPELYKRSLEVFAQILGSGARAAVVVPDMRLLAGARHFELLEEHKLWVHRSLTRHFCVLSRV